MKALFPESSRALIERRLPTSLEVIWWASADDATAAIPHVDIAWVDLPPPGAIGGALAAAGPSLRWLITMYAGLDALPLDRLRALGVTVTNGSGFNAAAVAEYAVLGVLAAAKRFDEVVRMADRQAWPADAPGKLELVDSRALILGMGTVGSLIAQRLQAFGVTVTGVTRSGRDGTLASTEWQGVLSEQDWIILAAPSTTATQAMVGGAQLAAMKPSAWLINVARGALVDEAALMAALEGKTIAGAFLDAVQPEPLPPGHPLWSTPNVLHSMHLSGRSTTRMFERAAALVVENLAAFLANKPLRNVVDLDAGY